MLVCAYPQILACGQ